MDAKPSETEVFEGAHIRSMSDRTLGRPVDTKLLRFGGGEKIVQGSIYIYIYTHTRVSRIYTQVGCITYTSAIEQFERLSTKLWI